MTPRVLLGACLGGILALSSISARGAAVQAPAARERYVVECASCHSLERNEFGPRMCGIMGRKAGSVSGFPYSEAMRKLDLTWTETALDEFLKAPTDKVPGTSMNYKGLTDAKERADLIAFIEVLTDPTECQSGEAGMPRSEQSREE